MKNLLDWNVSSTEMRLIHKIALKAVGIETSSSEPVRLMDVEMDITACHLNGNPLDLEKLLKAKPFDFCHDVYGILNNIDRTTGKLQNCFLPRCSKVGA